MNVYISADIEGTTGTVSWFQCGRKDAEHPDFDFARRMMTEDVNAAIRGARAVGAKRIVVKDSHGNSKNLLLDQLEPEVELVSGHGTDGTLGMMMGVDGTFDAAMLVGYHARAGTLHGIMEHTISGRVHRMCINGEEQGEIGMSRGVAGAFEVPVVMISSDLAGAAEFEAMGLGGVAVVVKEGYGRYMGRSLSRQEASEKIEQGAASALKSASAVQTFRPGSPVVFRIEFNRSEEADLAARLPGVNRIDAYTLEYSSGSFLESHQMAWAIFAMGGLGAKSDE
jgi:D-amino peptidase